MWNTGVDFTIDSRPVSISFRCPHCNEFVRISWKALNVPEYWGDSWEPVECPDCGEMVELGDWTYD